MLLFVLVVIWGIYYCQSQQSNFKEGLNTELAFDSVQTDYMADGIGHGMPISSSHNFGGNSLNQLNTILAGGRGY
jgi:hypothetical protein